MPELNSTATLSIEDWGRTDYGNALEKQKAYVQQRLAGDRDDTLIFTEHNPVYTTGLRKGAETNLIWDSNELSEKGIALHKTNRGGDITYHGPGQLTVYPIIHLEKLKDLHKFLNLTEELLISVGTHFGLETSRREGKTGIWIEDRKIAAIGVAVKSWVTYHGFALNVSTNLSHFSGIVPCGITDGTVTSLEKELGFHVEMDEVKDIVAQSFKKVFQPYLKPNG